MQVPDCELALAHGTGGDAVGTRMGSATLILGGRTCERRPAGAVTRRRHSRREPFWDATARGPLLLPRCDDLRLVIWYPRALLPGVRCADVSWIDGAGHRAPCTASRSSARARARSATPGRTSLAYVELDEGPRVMTNIVDVPPDSVFVGQRVTVVFTPTEDGMALPRFRPE